MPATRSELAADLPAPMSNGVHVDVRSAALDRLDQFTEWMTCERTDEISGVDRTTRQPAIDVDSGIRHQTEQERHDRAVDALRSNVDVGLGNVFNVGDVELDEGEQLTTGWERDLDSADSVVRQAVLVDASWAVGQARSLGRRWRDGPRWAAGYLRAAVNLVRPS